MTNVSMSTMVNDIYHDTNKNFKPRSKVIHYVIDGSIYTGAAAVTVSAGVAAGIAAGPGVGLGVGCVVALPMLLATEHLIKSLHDKRFETWKTEELEKANAQFLQPRGLNEKSDPEAIMKAYVKELASIKQESSEKMMSYRHFLVMQKTRVYMQANAELVKKISKETELLTTSKTASQLVTLTLKLSALTQLEDLYKESDDYKEPSYAVLTIPTEGLTPSANDDIHISTIDTDYNSP